MTKSMNIRIKNGKITIDGIKGVVGPDCEKFTAALESIGKVEKKTKTEDYDKSSDPNVNINVSVKK